MYLVIHETPFVEVAHVKRAEALIIRWKVQPDDCSFRETYLKCSEYVMASQPLTYFCTDLTLIGSLEREYEAWLAIEFYPEFYKKIQKTIYAAVVFSEDHFKALIVNYQLPADSQAHAAIHFNYFTSQEEAWFWLESIKKGHDTAVLPMAHEFLI